MKVLMVYPEYPDTFWSYKHALKFVSKKAAYPPLGLITVASMLPETWEKKLVDINIEKLKNEHILWADYIFISAMSSQNISTQNVITRCNTLGKTVVAGGPLFTSDYENYPTVDHFILNEAEITLPLFLNDLKAGKAKRIYQTNSFANVHETPLPDYSLVQLSKYSSICLQFSRGCPFNCEFCDITALLGHKSRIKTSDQIIAELDNIYNLGWRGEAFFVDDNFIGNKKFLKNNLLPAITDWMKSHGNPFYFSTEASINLADDAELMKQMTSAGFLNVFIGIETPQETGLEECNKVQNKNRSLLNSVKKVQDAGMEVLGGFIVGFDSDTSDIFRQQIDFIQKSGIISAMIGLLNAPTKSELYKRLKNEGRILNRWNGDNADASTNIATKMDFNELKSGYQQVIRGIYGGKPFYQRVRKFLADFEPKVRKKTKINFIKIMALVKSIFIIGIFNQNRKYYWQLFFWALFNRPRLFPMAITYTIYGYHYQKSFEKIY